MFGWIKKLFRRKRIDNRPSLTAPVATKIMKDFYTPEVCEPDYTKHPFGELPLYGPGAAEKEKNERL